MADEVIVRFNGVSFEYGANNKILDEVDFSIRRNSKITFMGQNGAGKSTIFQLIAGGLQPESGRIRISDNITIAIAKQVIDYDYMDLTVREFFQKSFKEKVYDIDPKIDAVLDAVNLKAGHDKIIKSFSGGQQARLLLASALIKDSDLLLLDEPTNNLDKEGIKHLTNFLIDFKKTVVVISHDADFLNAFTEGVLYLDSFTKKVQWYQGNYYDVLEQVASQLEKDASKNARLSKAIIDKKEKANYFANKGGRLRLLAKRMREAAEDMEENKAESKKDDKTIRNFTIPVQDGIGGEIIKITSLSIMKKHKPANVKVDVSLYKNKHLLISGPNGIGKSTLLESLVHKTAKGAQIASDVIVGYYKQDFSTLNFDETVYEMMNKVAGGMDEHTLRSTAAGFLITGDLLKTKIKNLSEGQKGLASLMKLVLLKPGLLILDEPTNHINFRHLPVIAKALDEYEGAMILVSHVHEFVGKIRIDEEIDLSKFL